MFSLHHSAFRRPAAFVLWAAAACCACVKTQTLETPQELSLSAVASVSAVETKANPELSGASLGTDNTYVIYASASATGEPSFMAGQLFRYSTSDARWHASPDPVFWPLQGVSLDFLALAMKPAPVWTRNRPPLPWLRRCPPRKALRWRSGIRIRTSMT